MFITLEIDRQVRMEKINVSNMALVDLLLSLTSEIGAVISILDKVETFNVKYELHMYLHTLLVNH